MYCCGYLQNVKYRFDDDCRQTCFMPRPWTGKDDKDLIPARTTLGPHGLTVPGGVWLEPDGAGAMGL